ncbi:dihydrolipoamide dehydrogenase [Rhizobium sp. NFR07]|uniref:dihydrolipoyl dehydrogenase n=1 Tax=Rhizobium sp. NFR07 TaxID=1566262 RepID=UPI0008E46E28|nr:dihydrolipoyl dehydrogenase [Rhizobium sp. NFR07]SFB59403.1 dihydrolipoamide dehydrogenase [Rhizobium sp. NFR07]
MPDRNCDVAIIGAGTAGLSAERSARRAGAKTMLIDERFAGTTCASVGCMPSKLLIAASKNAHSIASAAEFGIHARSVKIDGRAVMARVRKLRDAFVASTLKSLDDIPDGVRLEGTACFVEPGILAVDGARVVAKAIVIATGSRAAIPQTFKGLGQILTNETVFELEDLPTSLAVIGAGPLGLELAQAFARLGVDVEVFDEGDTIAALKDDAVAQSLRPLLEAEFPLRLGTSIVASQAGNEIEISWSGASSGKRRFSHVLVAAGRPPNMKELALEKAGLELDDHGIPIFDRTTMQCGYTPIFLAGDCDHDSPVLHEASAEGAIAGHNAARFPAVKPSKRSTPLAITFTDPPSASIGCPANDESVVGETDFSDQGRAKADGRNAGLVRLYADQGGKLTGATLSAPEAEHLAHLIAWAIEHGQTAMQVLDLPIYHPTYEEGLRSALRQICQQIDVGFAADRDEGSAPGI